MSYIFPSVTSVHFYNKFTDAIAPPGVSAQSIPQPEENLEIWIYLHPKDAFWSRITAGPASITSMASHLYTPEDMVANITALTFTKSW